jgi:NitT/TauT family transport system permease protein
LTRILARAREYWLAIAVFVALVAAWELGVRVGKVPPFVLPAPSAIAAKFVADLPLLRLHTLVTVQEILVGYVVAAAGGLLIAILIVRFKTVERVVYPYIVASQTVPKIAIAPLLIIWMGAGLRAAEENYLHLLHSVAASNTQVFVHLRVPYALPYIFAGLKLATTLSVLGAIVAEFMGASEGLGYLVLSSTFNFEVARVFVSLIVLIAVGVLFFGAVSLLERRLSWRQEADTRVVHAALA